MDLPKRFQLITHRDLFAVMDDGTGTVLDYRGVEPVIRAIAEKHPFGIGGLVIVPENAAVPPPDVRRAIADMLLALGKDLRCLAWLVEGSGFRGAAQRGVLTGIQMIQRRPYPTHVAASTRNAVAWILPHLAGGIERLPDVPSTLLHVERERSRTEMMTRVQGAA